MASTYTPIATTTLGSAASSYTFSSIPSTYTDLVLVANCGQVTGNNSFRFQINSDTGTNYSYTFVQGNGTATGSGRTANDTSGEVESLMNTALTGTFIIHFMNYANTTTYKTMIGRGSEASQKVDATVTLWRSTSAINSIKVYPGGGQSFLTGSTFTLYGVKNA